jgi:hypothetical protein
MSARARRLQVLVLTLALGASTGAHADDAPPCYVGPCDAPPASPPAAAAETSPPMKARKPTRSVPVFRGYGGIGYRRLYDVPFVMGDATASIGVRQDKLSVLGRFAFASGKSEGGLVLRDVGVGVEIDYRAAGVFHVGGGGGFSLGMLQRATNGHTLYDVGIMVFGFAAVDVIPFDERAIFLQATLAGELYMGHNSAPILWGPSAAVGLRF